MSKYFFEFTPTPSFISKMNKSSCFRTSDMIEGNKDTFILKLYSKTPFIISECLNDEGQVIDGSNLELTGSGLDIPIELVYKRTNTENIVGFNISIADNNSYNVNLGNTPVVIQSLFLLDKFTDGLIAYSRLNEPITVSDNIEFSFKDNIINVKNVCG